MTLSRTVILLTAIVLIVSGCGEKPATGNAGETETPPAVTVKEIAETYATFRQMTKEDVYVNPELASLCVGASRKMVQEAAKAHGPHAHTAIRVHMNDLAAAAFESAAEQYPVGSVVVKHKSILPHRDDTSGEFTSRADNGVGGMVKRSPGYDPDNGDWEYFYFEDQGEIESGKIQSCIDCHQEATDYVFGSWIPAPAESWGNSAE